MFQIAFAFTKTTLQKLQSALMDRTTVTFTGAAFTQLLQTLAQLVAKQTPQQTVCGVKIFKIR